MKKHFQKNKIPELRNLKRRDLDEIFRHKLLHNVGKLNLINDFLMCEYLCQFKYYLKEYLKRGLDLNEKNKNGSTMLHILINKIFITKRVNCYVDKFIYLFSHYSHLLDLNIIFFRNHDSHTKKISIDLVELFLIKLKQSRANSEEIYEDICWIIDRELKLILSKKIKDKFINFVDKFLYYDKLIKDYKRIQYYFYFIFCRCIFNMQEKFISKNPKQSIYFRCIDPYKILFQYLS